MAADHGARPNPARGPTFKVDLILVRPSSWPVAVNARYWQRGTPRQRALSRIRDEGFSPLVLMVGTIGTDHYRRYVVHTMPDEAEESAAPQGSEFHEVLPLIAPS